MDAQRMKESTLKRFFRLERFEEHLALHKMDCLAASGYLDHWEFVRERLSSMPEEAVRPTPLITGRELIAAGYPAGRAVPRNVCARPKTHSWRVRLRRRRER